MHWEPVIGLEVHVQLRTATKMFCRCPTSFGDSANTHTCPVCLGLPGALPVLNRRALELAGRAALALGGEIAALTKFDRKNYFYPDLPKAYQISQFDQPFCKGGAVALSDGRRIRLTRLHLEEDAGKLVHDGPDGGSGVDLNRCGAPLIEIVSEPELRSPDEAYDYLTGLKRVLRHVGVSDCDMEKGQLRCDANVSVHRPGTPFGTRRELKNLNSFKQVRDALAWEIEQQVATIERGGAITQATLGWDAERGLARVQRTKEEAHDYRYFPEPDLPELHFTSAWIEGLRAALPELPDVRLARYVGEFGLLEKEARALLDDLALMEFFEAARSRYDGPPKTVFNWVMQDFARFLHELKLGAERAPITPAQLVGLIRVLDAGGLPKNKAKECLEAMMTEGVAAEAVIDARGWRPTGTGELAALVAQVLAENEAAVRDFLGGKEQAFNGLLGRLMQKTKGQAPPGEARRLLEEALRARGTSGA